MSGAEDRAEPERLVPDRLEPQRLVPETKDWTWVVDTPCPECGFDPDYDLHRTGDRLRATVGHWQGVLAAPDAGVRPAPSVWSPLEYACHVRDTCRIFRERLALMLTEDDPLFANWDQDETAVTERYWAQDPAAVAGAYAQEAGATAAAFDGIPDDAWQRSGRRSGGSVFTVSTFAAYFLHDIEHHVHDTLPPRS